MGSLVNLISDSSESAEITYAGGHKPSLQAR